MNDLALLIRSFAILSLLAVGGGSAILPEMKHVVVEQFHWITADDFDDIYSLGQMAPGPNMLMVSLIGDKVAGVVGGIAVLIAFFLPASVLTLVSGRLWEHFKEAPAREALRRGLAPITIGLMLSGAVSIARTAIDGWETAVLAVAVLAILMWRSMNPLWLIGAAGLIGWLTLR